VTVNKSIRPLNVMLVEADKNLGEIWCAHIERLGHNTVLLSSQEEAIEALAVQKIDVLVLNATMADTSVLGISNVASYRNPDVAIILVSAKDFFSDGAIFNLIPNARGVLNLPVEPDDLASLVCHYGNATRV